MDVEAMVRSRGIKRKRDATSGEMSTAPQANSLFSDVANHDGRSSNEGGVSVVVGSSHGNDDTLAVNHDYARKFEHNKKREEFQKCERRLS